MTSVDIVVDPSVVGTVTVDLRDVPWDQALDLILRFNGLGWTRENGTIRVAPRTEMSSRKRVRTEATLRLPRGSWGSVTVASPGDEHNPTMVLLVESVQRGLRSRGYVPGPLVVDPKCGVNSEHSILHLQRWMREAIDG